MSEKAHAELFYTNSSLSVSVVAQSSHGEAEMLNNLH